MVLGDRAGPVGLQQPPEVIGLGLKLFADVRFRDLYPGVHPLKNEGVVGDVVVIADGLQPALKGLVEMCIRDRP